MTAEPIELEQTHPVDQDDRLERIRNALGGIIRHTETYEEDMQIDRAQRLTIDIDKVKASSSQREEDMLSEAQEPDPPLPPLTSEQNSLILDHMRIVDIYAKKYRGGTLTREDLKQEGMVGLVFAARRFDPDRGVQFSTFASRTVQGTILRAIRDRGRIIRPARSFFDHDAVLMDAIKSIAAQGEKPTDEELVELTGYSLQYIQDKRAALIPPIVESFGNTNTDDFLATQREEIAFKDEQSSEAYTNIDNNLVIMEALETLDTREKTIIQARAGLPPYDRQYSQEEISQLVGLSQSYIARLTNKALLKLRSVLTIDELV